MRPGARLRDEPGRQAAVERLDVLDTAPEQQFDKIVDLVRLTLEVPIVIVTLLDARRQWFKARHGMPCLETPREGSFCNHTIQARETMVVADATMDARFADSPMVIGDPHIRAYAGAPLRMPDGYQVGALCAIDTVPRVFTPRQIALLTGFAELVVGELELRLLASTDQLTGALTRRGFLAEAAREIARARRHGTPAALTVLDIDHFKAINDTHGHPAGDAVLRKVAERLMDELRGSDRLGRLGGEEFGVLLPQTDAPDALATAERLRRAVRAAPFPLAGGIRLPVTASFGVAPLGPTDLIPELWIAAADAPLYAAKRSGRDACRVAGDGPS